VVESAPLLREYTLRAYPGFESLSLRQLPLKIFYKSISYNHNRAKRSFGARSGTHNYFQSQLYFYPTHHPLSAKAAPYPRGHPPTSPDGTLGIGMYY
jgi:hypothetical protein